MCRYGRGSYGDCLSGEWVEFASVVRDGRFANRSDVPVSVVSSGCASLVVTGCFSVENGGTPVEITHSDQIAGSDRAEGTNPPDSRTKYMGDVVVSGQADTSVRVSWAIIGDRWTGFGTINNEGELFVTYTGSFSGSGTWVLRSEGTFTLRGSKPGSMARAQRSGTETRPKAGPPRQVAHNGCGLRG